MLSFFTNEFNKSTRSFAIPRPVWARLSLTSSEALVSSGYRGEREANYSSPFRLLLLQTPGPHHWRAGDLFWALSILETPEPQLHLEAPEKEGKKKLNVAPDGLQKLDFQNSRRIRDLKLDEALNFTLQFALQENL
ncbi:hypothetical protein HPG69_007285 [Diceros bicornis minor]|uniref:Uncharacterized protein n=1 Tax=Diceros bicornis minor TaxID=77932 RepID=A0A7J7FN65_DICBM|nr:hypothetical protein HPG69_007285 [Diceros bicornis minor]